MREGLGTGSRETEGLTPQLGGGKAGMVMPALSVQQEGWSPVQGPAQALWTCV